MAQGLHIKFSRILRGKIRSLGLRQHGIGVLAKTDQGNFIVDPKDFGVGRALLDKGAYDSGALDYLLGKIDRDSTVVFVGAHIGALLVPIAKQVADVIAFEPNPPTFEMLQANVNLNGLVNVTLYNLAASDREETLTINHNMVNTGGTSVSKSTAAGDGAVAAIPLDEIIADRVLDLMVVDAEGFEVQVFLGGQKTLGNTGTLYTEYGPAMLRRQNATTEDFVKSLRGHFKTMKIGIDASTAYAPDEWLEALLALPSRNSLIVNLTFSK